MTCSPIFFLVVLLISWICLDADVLDDFNQEFRETYDRARTQLLSKTGPLIICHGDNVIIIHRGGRFEEQVVPRLYHDLKSISHIPLKIYLTLMLVQGNLSADHFIELKSYLHSIRSIRNSIRFPPDIQQKQYDLIDLSIEYLRMILRTKFVDGVRLTDFCQDARRHFSENIDLAARIQLNLLHATIKPWYQTRFNQTERQSLKVLIMGQKTVRRNHLEKVYFYGLLGERHEGKHIIYAEGTDDEHEALQVLGTWLLDKRASTNFFGDHRRLHRDLLSDAANTYITQLLNSWANRKGDKTRIFNQNS